MKISEQRKKEFLLDLEKFMKDHLAEFYDGYEDPCAVLMPSVYDESGKQTHEYTEFSIKHLF